MAEADVQAMTSVIIQVALHQSATLKPQPLSAQMPSESAPAPAQPSTPATRPAQPSLSATQAVNTFKSALPAQASNTRAGTAEPLPAPTSAATDAAERAAAAGQAHTGAAPDQHAAAAAAAAAQTTNPSGRQAEGSAWRAAGNQDAWRGWTRLSSTEHDEHSRRAILESSSSSSSSRHAALQSNSRRESAALQGGGSNDASSSATPLRGMAVADAHSWAMLLHSLAVLKVRFLGVSVCACMCVYVCVYVIVNMCVCVCLFTGVIFSYRSIADPPLCLQFW